MPETSTPLVFVVGTGRCGTHSLAKVFESVPNTLSTHEGAGIVRYGPPSFVGKRVAIGFMSEFNMYVYHYGGEEVLRRTFDPDPEMLALMDGSFGSRRGAIEWCRSNGMAYCDANAFGFNFINYVHVRFPSARFIHLVRDGYACVRSWSRRTPTTYPDGIPVALAISYLLAKPVPFPSDPAYASWSRFDRVQKISWFWSAVNANIAERLTRIPDANKRLVRIEDVNEETLPAILEFCGLPRQYSRAALQARDATAGPEIEWTPENVRGFNALAAPMMEKLGYPLR